MTPTEINEKYPVRNTVWSFDNMTGRWTTEDSTWSHSGNKDPWNRDFPVAPGRKLIDERENEILGWVYTTTVDGQAVECVVFND